MASTFTTENTINPYGQSDDVLKIIIDSTPKAYRLANVVSKADTYTFVVWHKSQTNGNIVFNIFGNEYTDYSTSAWKKFVQTVDITSLTNRHIEIKPPINSTTYYYEGYLSRGSIDTSWSAAPEDDIENTKQLRSEIEQTESRINLKVENLEGQLSQLTIDINGITSRVEDAEGNISSLEQTSKTHTSTIQDMEGNISTITQSIDGLTSQIEDVEGNYSNLSQNLDGFKQEVSSKYPTNEQMNSAIEQAADEIKLEVSNIPIGGRNMLLNSNFILATEKTEGGITTANPNIYPDYWEAYNDTISNPTTSKHAYIDGETFGYNVLVYDESDGTKNLKSISQSINGITYKRENYVFSFDVYATGTGGKISGGMYYYNRSSSQGFHSGQFTVSSLFVNEWGRCSVEVPLNDDVNFSKEIIFYVYGYGFSSNIKVYITNLKLEAGAKPTDWSPAPEDSNNMMSSQISQTAESIQAQVSELDGIVSGLQITTDEISTEMNNAKGQSSSLSQRLDSISSSVDSLNKHSEFLQESDKFVAKITSLENNYIGIQPVINSMTFDENGLTIGVSNSNTYVRIDDEGLTIFEGDSAIAWFKDNNMYITTANIGTSIKIGAFTFKPEDNDSLSFGKF